MTYTRLHPHRSSGSISQPLNPQTSTTATYPPWSSPRDRRASRNRSIFSHCVLTTTAQSGLKLKAVADR